jgi:hypothetical protein
MAVDPRQPSRGTSAVVAPKTCRESIAAAVRISGQYGKDTQALGGHADAKMTEQYIQHPTIEWIEPPKQEMVGRSTSSA